MKYFFQLGFLGLALLAMAPASTLAETRMQVAASSTPVLNQAAAGAQSLGTVTAGEILFVSRIDGDWAAISPPERFDLWLNKDFIEGNRVVAKVIQIRSGPGIQHPVVGTLKRGAPVMPRGEQGDWAKISPPSSCILWVKKQDLEEVRTHTTPIREVTPVAEPKKPEPKPAPKTPAAPQRPKVSPPIIKSQPESPASSSSSPSSAPVKIAPSTPKAAAPKKPIRRQTTPVAPRPPPAKPAVTVKPATPKPVRRQRPSTTTSTAKPRSVRTVKTSVPASKPVTPRKAAPKPSPALRPATALPATQPAPAKTRVRRKRKAPAQSQVVPAPANTVSRKKSRKMEVQVDPALVEDLDLAEMPNQGKTVQVEGEVRNAPFLAASPSRYRLLDREGRVVEMVCHLHGDSTILRKFVGKGVSIRGREYWVENSDMPVVVVGEIAPLAPRSAADEPVLF